MSITRREFMAATSALSAGLFVGAGPAGASASGRVVRRDITKLSADELTAYRDAFRELQSRTGTNSYRELAGFHGYPDYYCHQDSRIFLPWHRAYMLRIEQALQSIDSSMALHYWDWTSDDAIENGIPNEFTDTHYESGGMMYKNPLHSADYQHSDGTQKTTTRNPKASFLLEDYRDEVEACDDATFYSEFNDDISGPHGSLHTWVRGEMGNTTYAAYDPIFWAHHSNVDRQWARWQESPNNADPSSNTKMLDLDPFGLKVSGVIDYLALGYEYDDIELESSLAFDIANERGIRIDNFDLRPHCTIAALYLHGLSAHPLKSFNVYVFINQPAATIDDVKEENPHFAGSWGIFGGEHGNGHDAKHKEMREGQPQTRRVLDLTTSIEELRKQDLEKLERLTLVATDVEGNSVELSTLPFDRISIQKD